MKAFFRFGIPLFLLALLALTGCSSWIKVYSEEEAGVNLAQYYTYDWLENGETPTDGPTHYPLSSHAQDRIRNATDQQMQRFGYLRCSTAPDLELHYHVIIENRVYFQHDWNCTSPEAMQQGYCHSVRPVYFREGTLLIDFVDQRTGRQVWRGAAIGTIENYTPDQWDAEIENAVRQIFKKFPVRPRDLHDMRTLAKK